MFFFFSKNRGCTIRLECGENVAVRLAAEDLVRDLKTRSGKKDGFSVNADGCARSDEAQIFVRCEPGEAESYAVSVSDAGVEICGADTLGMIYGIYSVSRRLLGFDPMFLFHDVLPDTVESLGAEAQKWTSDKRAVRLRGWFLNDEDLLTDWYEGGGDRHIDYRFYRHVMHPDVLDMVLETMLRLELNLIIPSSFVDILNPPERRLVETAVRRGVYVSQHHVEPLGVSWFAATAALGTEEVSYFRDPKALEDVWRRYVRAWASFGDRVIWQLGLRGKGDVPVWSSDPDFPADAASRGRLIGDAIARQKKLIAEELGGEPVCTMTLWSESADLYRDGWLKLPEGTVAVFSDIGPDSMFGDDFYRIRRRPDDRYGVYYHVAYYGRGAHLCEGVSPEKMAFAFREAARLRSLDYAIVNVSNVRPFVFGISLNAALLMDPQTDVEAFCAAFDRRFFGRLGEKVTEGRRRYFSAMGEYGEDAIREECERHIFSYHAYGKLPFARFALTDGSVRYSARFTMNGKGWVPTIDRDGLALTKAAAEKLAGVLSYWENLRPQIPEERRAYFDLFLLGQTRYLLRMDQYAAAVMENRWSDAAAAARAMLEERTETGEKWRDWYRGDEKINVRQLLADAEKRAKENAR